MNMSEKIRFYRKEKGLTQQQLGQLLNKSSQVISNWERGYTTTVNQDDIKKPPFSEGGNGYRQKHV